jgi:hypothetical protein
MLWVSGNDAPHRKKTKKKDKEKESKQAGRGGFSLGFGGLV